MGKSFWGSIVSMGVGLAISGCSSHAAVHDAGMLRDAPPTGFDAGPPAMDSGMVGIGNAYIRLVNLIPASPNLTVCIATIPGTGIAATTAHIIGQPDARLMSNGTLPYPGISPYLPAPIFDTPGFGYELRLYDQAAVPFVALGPCPAAGAQPAPIATIHATASSVMVNKHYSAVLIGVLPGTPVTCAGPCPEVQLRMFEDNLSPPPPGNHVKSRLFQAVPNLPGPIHVCFDLDYVSAANPGFLSPTRVLPAAADMDGLAFGEVSTYISIPSVTSVGAFYTHQSVAGVPDCDPSTLLLGPTTVPLPVPVTAPREVARVFGMGDVITNFAFGRRGSPCTTAADCVAPTSICTNAPCTCDGTGHCADDLAGNLLPWRDVLGDFPPDAGMPPPMFDADTNDAGM